MYVPGYGVSLAGSGASGAGLCVPQYVTFNPLQHQYSLMTPGGVTGTGFSSSSYVTSSQVSTPIQTTTNMTTTTTDQQQQQQPEEQHKQTVESSQNSNSGLTSPCSSNSTSTMIEEANAQYIKELKAEKEELEKNYSENANAIKLLFNEISRLESGLENLDSDGGFREPIKYFDIYRERPVRLTVRALIPVKEHPKFNFVGKLLGPKGNSMKRLQEETMTKMAVLGRGSMRDKQKEEELRASQDPKYQHLQEDLHVEITAFAPPAEAHARIAFALTEVRKYLIPDSNDEIRQEQMRELEMISVNGDSVLDTLKQQSQAAMLLNQGLGGLGASTLQFPASGAVPASNPLSPILGGVAASNAFVASSFQQQTPTTNIMLPASLESSDRLSTPGQAAGQEAAPSQTQSIANNNLKSVSSCSPSNFRHAAAPYPAKHV